MASIPLPASAGLDLTWNACGAAGGDSVTLACTEPDSVTLLNGFFQVPDTIPRFFAMDAVIDVETEAPELPPFWHLENGGCNRFGIGITHSIPDSGCAAAVNPWGPDGRSASFVNFIPDSGAKNRVRLICALARSSQDPTTLVPGTNYFAFQLRFFYDNAAEAGGNCAGCPTPVTFRWVSCIVHGVAEEGKTTPFLVVAESPACVRANGARPGACAALGDTLPASGR